MTDQPITTILWRGKFLILAVLVSALAFTYWYTSTLDRVYEATAILQVDPAMTPGATTDPLQIQEASQGIATTYATLITQRSFLAEIAPQVADGQFTAGELKSRLEATAIEDTSLISVRAEGDSADEARSLAQEVSQAFIDKVVTGAEQRSRQLQAQLQERITELTTQIEELAASPAGVESERLESLRSAREALTGQLAGVVANGIEAGGSVTLTAEPTGPSVPVRPRPILNLLAAALLALLAGTGLAWLRVRLDRKLHSSAETEELLGAPVLASIPLRKKFSPADPVLEEAYDFLRANMAFLALDNPLQLITITSYSPGEGKTASVEGLAHAAARSGMNVVAVDGDIRPRLLTKRLGLADLPGLTTAVSGMAPLEGALTEKNGLTVLPAGPTPPNPASLLSSARMGELFSQLREMFSLILVDCPPVAHLADASLLAAHADGIVVVARVNLTERAHLAAVAANLRHSPTPLLGSIVIEPRTISDYYYPTRAPAPAGSQAVRS